MPETPDRSLKNRLTSAVAGVAPTIATALGGPLAGAAVATLRDKLFGEDASVGDRALEEALMAGDPETMLKVKEAEVSFRKAVLDAGLEARRIAAADRADARAREVATKDRTPAVLGTAVIGGFFAVLGIMLWRDVPTQAETEFSILLGALATMSAAVVNYYFGSSADSAEKTRLMGDLR